MRIRSPKVHRTLASAHEDDSIYSRPYERMKSGKEPLFAILTSAPYVPALLLNHRVYDEIVQRTSWHAIPLLLARSIKQLCDIPEALPQVRSWGEGLMLGILLGKRTKLISRHDIYSSLLAVVSHMHRLMAHPGRLSNLVVIVVVRHEGATDPLDSEPLLPALKGLPKGGTQEQLYHFLFSLVCCAYNDAGTKVVTLDAEYDGQKLEEHPTHGELTLRDVFDVMGDDFCVGMRVGESMLGGGLRAVWRRLQKP